MKSRRSDGIVDVRAGAEGEVVTAGQAVVTLIDPDDLWVRADIEETYIDRVKIGDTLTRAPALGRGAEGTVFYRGVDAGFATQRDVSRTKRDIKTFEIRLRVRQRRPAARRGHDGLRDAAQDLVLAYGLAAGA